MVGFAFFSHTLGPSRTSENSRQCLSERHLLRKTSSFWAQDTGPKKVLWGGFHGHSHGWTCVPTRGAIHGPTRKSNFVFACSVSCPKKQPEFSWTEVLLTPQCWAVIWGGAKRMGGGKRTRERALPKMFGPLQKSFCSALLWIFVQEKQSTDTWEGWIRACEGVPYEGGPKPLFGGGVTREVFLPPLFSTPPWRPLTMQASWTQSFKTKVSLRERRKGSSQKGPFQWEDL